MPWSQHWEPAPKDMSLPVMENLPEGVAEQRQWFSSLREADGYINGEWKQYYFCHWCKGWIEGHANEYSVNTLNPGKLAGRQGTEYCCRRCGREIAFNGLMS